MTPPAVRLRPGRPEDASILTDLTWRLTISHPTYGDQARAMPEAVTGPTDALSAGDVVVAEVESRPVGYVALVRGDEDVA